MRAVNRIAYVDGLRAVAVLAVVFYHAAISTPHPNRSGILSHIFGQGAHGVELFFVLSGFCLAYPTLLRLRDGDVVFDVARYTAQRLTRIAPPYYIALALFIVLSIAFNYHVERLTFANVLHQAAFLDRGTDFINPSFWTLPIEMRWYVAFPVALWLWIRLPKSFLVLLPLLIVAEQTHARSTDIFALPAFLLGIVAADCAVRPRLRVRSWWPLFFAALAFTLLVAPTRELNGAISIPWEVTAALLVLAAGDCLPLQRLLSFAPLAFIGAASYSIYLVHHPIMEMIESRGTSPAVAILVALAAGIAFWAVAERPFLSSRVRGALNAKLEPLAKSMLKMLGIGYRIPLQHSRAPVHILPAPLAARPDTVEQPLLVSKAG